MVKVTISQGTLSGAKCNTANQYEYIEFLQIPYAKPPIGELRFQSPQPPEIWSGERDASSYDDSKISLQFDTFTKTSRGSEDCLYLNVFTPRLYTANKLPVMVYIHGGAFIVGSGTNKLESGPDFLIERDVIVVTLNYRLNVFGFLSLDIPEAAGNMGLKDQVMALKWVQNNIGKFGGDKNNVTVFGVSAGSASVEYLLLSPSAKGLFHKAILQSGSSLNHWATNYDVKELSIKLAQKVGFDGPVHDSKLIWKYLIEQSTEKLSQASFKYSGFDSFKGLDFGFVPSIENDYGNGESFLTESPYELLKAGKFHKVPVIRGFCEHEGYFALAVRPQNIQELKEKKKFSDFWIYKLNNPNELNKKFEILYSKDENNPEKFAIDFFTDYDFVAGIWIGSEIMAVQGVPVYCYMFSYDGVRNFVKKMFLNDPSKEGACHGDDAGYVMGTVSPADKDISETEMDVLVKNRMVEMWTNFAKTSNPTPNTSETLPVLWPQFTAEQQQYLKIDQDLTVEYKYQPNRMAVFEEIYQTYKK